MGYMIVDSLDSLLLMGFEEEYKRAREWIRGNLRKGFEVEGKVNGFEVGFEGDLRGCEEFELIMESTDRPDHHSDSRRSAFSLLPHLNPRQPPLPPRLRPLPRTLHRPRRSSPPTLLLPLRHPLLLH